MCRTFRSRWRRLVRASQSRPTPDVERRPGRVFVLRADLIEAATRSLLISSARVVIVGAARKPVGPTRSRHRSTAADPPVRQISGRPSRARGVRRRRPSSSFSTGSADLRAGGKEYVTILGPGQSTPAPWINVIANPAFGFQVATEGGGYTWSGNSRENQLTPWSNDPVSDPPGRGVLSARRGDRRALESDGAADPRPGGDLCRPSRLRATAASSTRRTASQLTSLQFVPLEGSIKISRLKLTNTSGRARVLAVTAYVEWVLGAIAIRLASVCRNRNGLRRQARCSRAIPGIRPSVRGSRSLTCAAPRPTGRATGASSSAATAAWRSRQRCGQRPHCRKRSAPALTPAPRCAPRLNCRLAASRRSSSFSATRLRARRPARRS